MLPPFPQRSRIPTWKLILLVGAVAGTLTAVYAVYNATTGLIHTSPGCNTMVVGLTAPEAVPNGFRFGVTLVSRSDSVAEAKYLYDFMQANSTIGYANGATLAASTPFVIGGQRYALNWSDVDGGGRLTVGDEFTLTRAGGLLPSTTYAALLGNACGTLAKATYESP